mgnify:FL=1
MEKKVVDNYDVRSNLNKFKRLLLKMIRYINITEITENTVFESSILFLYLTQNIIDYYRKL